MSEHVLNVKFKYFKYNALIVVGTNNGSWSKVVYHLGKRASSSG